MCLAKNKHLLSRLAGNMEPRGGERGQGVTSLCGCSSAGTGTCEGHAGKKPGSGDNS